MISVIMPVHIITPILNGIRKRICDKKDTELILVLQNNVEIKGDLFENEYLIHSNRTGRGNNFALGLEQARGEVVLFQHADTLLPENWDVVVKEVLENPAVVGGGFRLCFDLNSLPLKILTRLSDLLFNVTGEIWGDRSLFVRATLIKANKYIIDVPIMEDVRLSHFLKGKGKVKLLKECVITSAGTFSTRGILKHTCRILRCRSLYILKKDFRYIYDCYYS